jgi:hypothetical protein
MRPPTLARSLSPFLLALATAPSAWPQAGPDPVLLRDELRAMGQLLGQSVERVSAPNPGLVLAGAASCRGYLLEGYGVVFVVPPRRLPMAPTAMVRVRSGGRRGTWTDEVVVVSRTQRREPGLQELEAQVDAFQREAALHRAEAERAFDEMTRMLWARLAEAERGGRGGAAPPPPSASPSPAATLAAEPVAPVVPTAVSAPSAPSEAMAPAAPPRPPRAMAPVTAPPPLPPPAPWFFLGDEGTLADDGRASERLVADVHEAVVQALEAHVPLLSSLRPEESISVVVDFVAGTPFLDEDARPRRSLTLKVKKKDLDERRSGRLSPEDLRRRVEAVEY